MSTERSSFFGIDHGTPATGYPRGSRYPLPTLSTPSAEAHARRTVGAMDENMDRTPHPEDPAEGAADIDGVGDSARTAGDPADIPQHNTAPDGYSTADGGAGAAVHGDSSDGGVDGADQGDASSDRAAPLGGHETTREQLDADNEVEEDSLKTLDPDDPPA